MQTWGAHLCCVLPLTAGDGLSPSESDLAHWAKNHTSEKCPPVRHFRQIERYHVKMPQYSDPQCGYMTCRAFLWVGVGMHTLWNIFMKVFPRDSKIYQLKWIKVWEEKLICTVQIFPVLRQMLKFWNTTQRRVCSTSSMQLKRPPHQQMTLRQDKNCPHSGPRHSVGALQSLRSNSPKLRDKASVLREDCKAAHSLALHLGCYKIYFCPHSFFTHKPDTSRIFYSRFTLHNNQQ